MIVVVSDSYGSIVQWCRDHNFNIRDIIALYEVRDLDKLLGYKITSVVYLPEFHRHSSKDVEHISAFLISRMRIQIA